MEPTPPSAGSWKCSLLGAALLPSRPFFAALPMVLTGLSRRRQHIRPHASQSRARTSHLPQGICPTNEHYFMPYKFRDHQNAQCWLGFRFGSSLVQSHFAMGQHGSHTDSPRGNLPHGLDQILVAHLQRKPKTPCSRTASLCTAHGRNMAVDIPHTLFSGVLMSQLQPHYSH